MSVKIKKPLTPAQKRKLEEAKRLMAEEGFALKGKPEDAQEQSRQAEAIAKFIRNPADFGEKTCGECRRMFLVNYPSVGYCSDICRKAHLRSKGIQWSPDKTPQERWAPADIPLTIPPDALAVLVSLASQVTQQESHLALSS